MASNRVQSAQRLPKQNRTVKLTSGGSTIRSLQKRGITGSSLDVMDAARAVQDDVEPYIEEAAV